MSPAAATVILLILSAPPLVASAMGARIAWHYIAVTLGGVALLWAVFGMTALWEHGVWLDLPPERYLGPIDRAYQDTYYVVAYHHYVALLGASFVLPAIVYALTRSTPDRGRDRLLFWLVLALTLLHGVAVPLVVEQVFVGRPSRYLDYPGLGTWLMRLRTWAALAQSLAFACAVILRIADHLRQP